MTPKPNFIADASPGGEQHSENRKQWAGDVAQNKLLVWSDGQPLFKKTVLLGRPSPVVTAARLATSPTIEYPHSGDDKMPEQQPRHIATTFTDRTGRGEYKEASVPPTRYWFLTIGVCLGLFLSLIDTSIVATSIYTIGQHFGDMRTVNWVALAYTLTYLGCAVTFARVSDLTGRKWSFIAAHVIFLVFSLACGCANSLTDLIAFRAMQGIGGSGLYSLTMIILPELSPKHLQSYIGSIIGLVIAGSGVLGPVLGGALTEYTTWRWVFWIKYAWTSSSWYSSLTSAGSVPVGAVSLAIFLLTWPPAEQLPTTPKRKWHCFDYPGAVLILAGSILVVFAFQNAGEQGSSAWSKATFLATFIIGILCWVALIAWCSVAKALYRDDLSLVFPISLFTNRAYASAAGVTMLLGFPYLMIIYSFPIRLQVVSGKSPLVAGIMLLPMLGTLALGAMIQGRVSKVKNFTLEASVLGALSMALGCGLMTMVKGSGDDVKALGFLTFLGLGFGLAAGSATLLTLIECPISDYAPAQGIIAQARIFGGSFGIAASTALVERRTAQCFSSLKAVDTLSTVAQGQELSKAYAEAKSEAYSKAFRDGMLASLVMASLAVIVALSGWKRGQRQLIRDLQEDLVYRENKRRAVPPHFDAWELEALKRKIP